MKLKTLLISSTAVALLAASGVALAAGDNNISNLTQNGANNSAAITQDGDDNKVNNATQTDDRNILTILQDSDQDSVANLGNTVGTVTQTGRPGASGTSNSLDISQDSTSASGAGNTITTVIQSKTAAGTGNQMSITQSGDGNTVNWAKQYGLANIATIVQDGTDNTARVSMGTNTVDVTGNTLDLLEQTGSGQTAYVSITGNNNGGGLLNDTFVSLLPNVPASQIIQGDADNYVNLQIAGSNNQFGITQGTPLGGGTDNTVGAIVINGSNNQLAIEQHNSDNLLGLAAINGNDNDIAVAQDGGTQVAHVDVAGNYNHALVQQFNGSYVNNNSATLNIDGSGNYSLIGQVQGHNNKATVDTTGNGNYTGAIQTGDDSKATINVIGNNNGVFGVQVATGSDNVITASVNGNNNNLPADPLTKFGNNAAKALAESADSMSGLLGPLADEIEDEFDLTLGNGLQPGALIQVGEANTLNLKVGNLTVSNDNLFATVQSGDNNKITGRINGDSNQVAVLQDGNSNSATFTQNGSNNVAAISQ